MELSLLELDNLNLLAEIDRSEWIQTQYTMEGDDLVARDVSIDVPPWDRDGTGAHSVSAKRSSLQPIVERGAKIMGAFHGTGFAGVAVLDDDYRPHLAWLVFLHVSRPFRRMGAARALWDECVRRAIAAGNRQMYVSATPSGSAVGFYLAQGCTLATPPDPDLFREEPDDIHFVFRLPALVGGDA